jgi:hypothetical protein
MPVKQVFEVLRTPSSSFATRSDLCSWNQA